SASMVLLNSPRRASSALSLQGDGSRGLRLASYSPASMSHVGRIGTGVNINQQDELQGLNKRLANYLSKVKTLEIANKELEIKIKNCMAKRGNDIRDWSSYEKPVMNVCKQVQETNMDNAGLTLQLDNCELASDDFKVKWQSESDLRQSVDQDLNGLRKILDDTNVGRMQLESQIEAMNEELSYLRKNHLEINSLEDTLEDNEERTAAELQTLNLNILNLEQQLADLHTKQNAQNVEYQILLNTKMRLQAEINTYRGLLEAEGSSQSEQQSNRTHVSTIGDKKAKKVIIISQKIVNGKMISEKHESEEMLG
ncbi:hypothetical protein scyTo_0021498, partial [Scyliorhinus torazame]|nr:hypothetical protein [Scyliorhinus torazame]